jgi:hypothetical protein
LRRGGHSVGDGVKCGSDVTECGQEWPRR